MTATLTTIVCKRKIPDYKEEKGYGYFLNLVGPITREIMPKLREYNADSFCPQDNTDGWNGFVSFKIPSDSKEQPAVIKDLVEKLDKSLASQGFKVEYQGNLSKEESKRFQEYLNKNTYKDLFHQQNQGFVDQIEKINSSM